MKLLRWTRVGPMVVSKTGDFVKYEDYKCLLDEIEVLRAIKYETIENESGDFVDVVTRHQIEKIIGRE